MPPSTLARYSATGPWTVRNALTTLAVGLVLALANPIVLLKFPLTRHIVGTLGYSHFFPGDFIRQSGSAKDIDFVYVETQFTF